jgi:hypothetical protein
VANKTGELRTDVAAHALERREAVAKKAIGSTRSVTVALLQRHARCAAQTQNKRKKKKKKKVNRDIALPRPNSA